MGKPDLRVTRDELDALITRYGVEVAKGRITTPGKFQGEPAAAVYWYNSMAESLGGPEEIYGDDDVVGHATVITEFDDRKVLDIPKKAEWVVLWQGPGGHQRLEYANGYPGA